MYAIRSYYAAIPGVEQEPPSEVVFTREAAVEASVEDQSIVEEVLQFAEPVPSNELEKQIVVITSYSIHYTKLYEQYSVNEFYRWAHVAPSALH